MINRKYVHMFSLFAGAYGFLSMYFITDPSMLIVSFVCIGFSWGSILSMPYAMLSSTLNPKKMGVLWVFSTCLLSSLRLLQRPL